MNKRVDITICVDNVVIIDKIFYVKPGNSDQHFISEIIRFINVIKTGKIKKGSLEK